MRIRKANLVMVLAAILLITGSSAMGQIIYGQPASGNLRLIYSHWSLDMGSTKTEISQLMVPVSGFIPVQENMELRFFTADASNTATYDGTDYTLSGLSDMRLQLNNSFADDRYLLSLGLNLPTGKKKLSHADEQPVMTLLTQNYLSFPVRRLGEGFGLNVLAGAATTSGNSRLGGSIAYQINGSYVAYEGDGDYKPGNMFSVGINADTRSEMAVLSGDMTFTTYSTDKLDSRKVFKQSDQFEIHVGGVYGATGYDLRGDVRYLIRGRNESYNPDETVGYRLKVYGNELAVSGSYSYHPQTAWYVSPLFELRFISANEFETTSKLGKANNIGFGAEFGHTLGSGFDAGLGFKYYTGSADGGNIDLTGYRLSATIQADF